MKTLSEIWEKGNVVKETPLVDDGVIIIYELEGKQYKIRNNNKGDIIKLSGLDDGTPIYYNITYDEYLKLSNYANGGDIKKHWDKEYRDGGSISSDRRFTEWDFNKLMASDKFRAVWSGNLWEIIEEGRTTVLGKFNPKTKSLYISGDKNMDNFLVVWMTENGFVNSNEYTILANGGGGVGNDWFWNHAYRHYMRDASLEQRNKVKAQFIKEGLELNGESPRHSAIISSIVGEYANGGGVGDLIISEIVDGEIRIYEKNINNLLSFVGEGIGNFDVYSESLSGKSNIKTDEIQNEVNITFVENAWGGISLEEWEQVKNKLDKYIGKGGFEDYTINSSSNSLTLEFVGEYPIGEYANGGGVERIDLFEDYENIPTNIQEILDEYSQDFEDGNYDGLAKALEEVESQGYTFEYYLDGQAYGLRPIGVPLNELKGYEDMGEEYAGGGAVSYRTVDKIIKKLKNKGYSFGDNLKLTEKFNGKEINLNFYFKFVQEIDEIEYSILQIQIISKYLDFDRVDGLYETDDVLDWKLYKGKNLVCSIVGYWDDAQSGIEYQPTVIKIGDIESSVFDFFPRYYNGDLDDKQLGKNLKNALNEIKQKNLYSAVVSLEGYEQYSEKVDGLENAKQAIQDIKENTRFQVVKGDVASGDLIKQDEVIENYANGGGVGKLIRNDIRKGEIFNYKGKRYELYDFLFDSDSYFIYIKGKELNGNTIITIKDDEIKKIKLEKSTIDKLKNRKNFIKDNIKTLSKINSINIKDLFLEFNITDDKQFSGTLKRDDLIGSKVEYLSDVFIFTDALKILKSLKSLNIFPLKTKISQRYVTSGGNNDDYESERNIHKHTIIRIEIYDKLSDKEIAVIELGGFYITTDNYDITEKLIALENYFSNKYANGGGVNQELSDIEIKELLTDFTKYISKSEQGIENSINEYISRYNKGVFNETIDKNHLKETILISFYRFRYHDNFRQDLGVVTRFLNDYDKFADGGGIKGKELWFSPYGEVKAEKRGTAKDYIEKHLAKSFGAEYMELVGEDENDYIYELNGNPMMIAAKTAILQEETNLDIETYGRKKRVHIPKKSIDQTSVHLRYPLITPFKNGGGVDSPKYDNASNWNPDYCKCIKDIRFKDSLNFFEGFEYTYDEDKYIRVYYMDGRGVTMTKETFDKHFEKIGKDKDKQAYANGGAIKTDFNELENTELRNVLISFWNDFFNNHIGNYLSIEKENYILSNIDNVFVIVRDEDKGNFSDVEKQNIDRFLSPYFDSDKKPLFTDFFNNYEIKDNKIIIYIKDMYANGGGVGIGKGDNVIWNGNKYILSKIENKLIGGLNDIKYHLLSTNKGVEDAILDSLNGVKKYANGGGVEDDFWKQYSNDALNDMIVNLSRFENTEDMIEAVKFELKNRSHGNSKYWVWYVNESNPIKNERKAQSFFTNDKQEAINFAYSVRRGYSKVAENKNNGFNSFMWLIDAIPTYEQDFNDTIPNRYTKRYDNGGGVDYDTRWAEMEAYSPYTSRAEYENKKEYEDLAFASKTFSKTSEMLVRENLNNGEICMCKLTKILGHEPNYPIQIVGSLKLEKCFMKRFYKLA